MSPLAATPKPMAAKAEKEWPYRVVGDGVMAESPIKNERDGGVATGRGIRASAFRVEWRQNLLMFVIEIYTKSIGHLWLCTKWIKVIAHLKAWWDIQQFGNDMDPESC